jgi:hypothetical protein
MPYTYSIMYNVMPLDPLLTLVIILVGGWVSAMLAQAARIPRVVGMIFFGVAFYPAASDAITSTLTYVSTNGGGVVLPGYVNNPSYPSGSYPIYNAASPASTMRTVALLFALARGSFGLSLRTLRAYPIPILALCMIPYFLELLIEAGVAQTLLPSSAGLVGPGILGVMPFVAASLWAPLSPSLCIPNMLTLTETFASAAAPVHGESKEVDDLKKARIANSPANLILVVAPLEVATALITYGSMLIAATATTSGSIEVVDNPGMIPLWVLFAILFGIAVSFILRLWRFGRSLPKVIEIYGEATPAEQMLTFIVCYFLCYVYVICIIFYN